jgi:hypothetical protein
VRFLALLLSAHSTCSQLRYDKTLGFADSRYESTFRLKLQNSPSSGLIAIGKCGIHTSIQQRQLSELTGVDVGMQIEPYDPRHLDSVIRLLHGGENLWIWKNYFNPEI